MVSEVRKLHLIEEVLKIDNEHTLSALEAVLAKSFLPQKKLENPFKALSGIWSKEEAEEIEKAITENCEQMNPDDWK
jgi:hypothetical protein